MAASRYDLASNCQSEVGRAIGSIGPIAALLCRMRLLTGKIDSLMHASRLLICRMPAVAEWCLVKFFQ